MPNGPSNKATITSAIITALAVIAAAGIGVLYSQKTFTLEVTQRTLTSVQNDKVELEKQRTELQAQLDKLQKQVDRLGSQSSEPPVHEDKVASRSPTDNDLRSCPTGMPSAQEKDGISLCVRSCYFDHENSVQCTLSMTSLKADTESMGVLAGREGMGDSYRSYLTIDQS